MSVSLSKMMGSVNSVIKGLVFSLFVSFLVACSLEPLSEQARVWVRIEGDLAATAPRNRSVGVVASTTPAPAVVAAFDCLGVNVMGPGIPDTGLNPEPNPGLLFDRLLRRESYCSYRGMLAGPLVAGASQPQEVSLTIPPGASRLIQVVGIQEIGGSNSCISEFNQAVAPVIDPSGRPLEGEAYELGRAVVDLFSDRAITLSTEWNDLSNAQRLEREMSCGGSTPSPSPTVAAAHAIGVARRYSNIFMEHRLHH
jgi:hypothetical protein